MSQTLLHSFHASNTPPLFPRLKLSSTLSTPQTLLHSFHASNTPPLFPRFIQHPAKRNFLWVEYYQIRFEFRNIVITYHCIRTKLFTKNFFSKCEQIRRKLRIRCQILKKSLTESFIPRREFLISMIYECSREYSFLHYISLYF